MRTYNGIKTTAAVAIGYLLLLLLSGMQNMDQYHQDSARLMMTHLDEGTTTTNTTNTTHSTFSIHSKSTKRKRNTGKVGIVVVSDKKFQTHQQPLYKTHRDYARKHGYEYHVLEPNPSCQQVLERFFFVKHCTVRKFLYSKQNEDQDYFTVIVLDGDVIVAAPDVSLDRWIRQQDVDVLLYEREWTFEITAGNYMVRNTPIGMKFLRTWEQYDYRARSITGYHSSDNGAIHLAVLQVLEIPFEEYEECDRRYQLLKSDVINLTEYYAFVACTRRVLGPNRKWELPHGGSLTVVHRYHGFAVDHFVAYGRPGGGIPFYHGDKDPAVAFQRHNSTAPWKSAEEQSLGIHEEYLIAARNHSMNQVPRVNLKSCLRNFSCQPASMHGEPRRDYYARHNHTRIFEYYSLFNKSSAWSS